MGYSISPASLRLDDLTPTILNLLRASGERTVTIAPEVGSDRLRRVVNKTVTNDEILAAAEMIFAAGMENLKLYYMIGLPTETDDDLVAIRDQTLQMRDIMMRHAEAAGTSAASSAASTRSCPSPAPPISGCRWRTTRRSTARSSACGRSRPTSRTSTSTSSRSGTPSTRRCSRSATAASRRPSRPPSATAATGAPPSRRPDVDADFYVFRDRSDDTVLPWDIIDGGMKDSFFRAEMDKARREEWTLPPKRQKENARLLTVLS